MSFQSIFRGLFSGLLSIILCTSALNAAEIQGPTFIPIGVTNTLQVMDSSASISAGDYIRRGINVALAQYAEKLKKKNYSIKLEEFSYANSELEAMSAAKKAIESDVLVVHGYDYSSHALAAAPLHQKAKLAFLTPTATADRVASFGSYVHQVSFNNSFQAKILARFAYDELHARRALIVAAKDCAYCQDLETAFGREFSKLGAKISASTAVLSNDQDFTALVNQITMGEKPDIIFLPNYEVLSARLISAFLRAGVNIPFLGGDGWNSFGEKVFSNVMAAKDFRAYAADHWNAAATSKVSKKFKKDFVAAYGVLPDGAAALSYDTMCLILEAVLRAKSLTREAIEQELSKISAFHGATGKIGFTASAQNARSLYILKLDKKGFSLIKELTAK